MTVVFGDPSTNKQSCELTMDFITGIGNKHLLYRMVSFKSNEKPGVHSDKQ
jgi:hypothetical protein